MRLNKFLLGQLSFRFIFLIFSLCFTSSLHGQTYSNEEIVISGLGFARFGVTIVPEKSFVEHPDSRRWLRIIDRNLCWSGVFLVNGSRYKTCRIADTSQIDMKILLKLEKRDADSGA